MARLHTSGFEINDLTSDSVAPGTDGDGQYTIPEWTTVVGAACSITADAARSGNFGLRVSGLSSGTRSGVFFRTQSVAALGVRFLRAYLYVVTPPSAANRIAFFTGTAAGGTQAVWVALNNDMTLTLGDEDGAIGTGTTVLALNTWYRINLEIDNDNVDPGDIAGLFINGVEEVRSTARSIAATLGGYQLGGNLNGEAHTVGEWYFDDVALNDETGTEDITHPPAGSVVHMLVTGHSAAHAPGIQGTDWDTGTGDELDVAAGTGLTAWEMLDEASPDMDTTWIKLLVASSGVANRAHHYTLQNCADVGIGAEDTIRFVHTLLFIRGVTTSNCSYVASQRVQSGTVASTGTITNGSVDWNMKNGAIPKWGLQVAYTDPDLAAWTPTTLDGLELGFRAIDISPNPHITWLAAQVEFEPAEVEPPAGGGTGRLSLLGIG